MVQSMNNASSAAEQGLKRPQVVEIIGPAGAGKTTLFKSLGGYPEKIRLSTYPKVRKAADAPFFIRYGLQLVPSLFRLYRGNSRHLSQREYAWMSILKGWPFILQQDVKKSSQVIVLDQGPVYLLAEMREFGPEYLRSKEAEILWQELYYRWAATLDMIVWLDATDITLLERIQARDQEHVVKNDPAQKIFEFLARYRRVYDFVLSMLETNKSSLRVLRFDTSKQQPGEIVDYLSAEFGFPSQTT
jgi:energy-coupling factor transporter ATP-binding protein EcfA2